MSEIPEDIRKAANECVANFRWNNDNRWHEFVAHAILAERERWLKALTPSAETKAAYIGEFSFSEEEFDPDLEEFRVVKRVVPWPTIKEIMVAIRAYAVHPTLTDEAKARRSAEVENHPLTPQIDRMVKTMKREA